MDIDVTARRSFKCPLPNKFNIVTNEHRLNVLLILTIIDRLKVFIINLKSIQIKVKTRKVVVK